MVVGNYINNVQVLNRTELKHIFLKRPNPRKINNFNLNRRINRKIVRIAA